jgi:hypothetical protein
VFNGINVQTNANLKGYTFEYPERYESIIEITQYQSGNDVDIKTSGSGIRSSAEKPVIIYKLFRAFPHSIGTLQTDWGINNEYHILPVQFYYQSWTSNYLESGTTYDVGNSYNPTALDITTNPVKALTDEAVRLSENAVNTAGDWLSRHNPFN